jgi:dynein heavy chain
VFIDDNFTKLNKEEMVTSNRWMDGAFLDLEAEVIEGEVDEYWREIYKIQKVFNQKLKKMQIEIDEINRERKKKRRLAEDDGTEGDVEPDAKLTPPAAVTVCNAVQDQMTEFKVCILNNDSK